MPSKTRYSFLILLFFVAVLAFVFKKDFGGVAGAATTQYFSGYAWSSNIGWISFRNGGGEPVSYGVDYDTTSKLLSGYAWSSNMGWVSFGCGGSDGAGGILCSESAFAPNYPTGGGVVRGSPAFDSTTNKLVGFARVCSVFVSGCSGPLRDQLDRGGWDGWISLSGDTSEATPNHYGIWFDNASQKFSGFAWGGGQESSPSGNISPQFPGWISYSSSAIGTVGTGGNCADGIKNGDETGIDSGGRCGTGELPIGPGTGTCFDNIRNGNETAPDYGGRCGTPGGPVGGGGDGTCFDNIYNGDETGVDIGGRCGSGGPVGGGGGGGDGTGTCFDNVKNGDETGVDIGGRCGSGDPGLKLCGEPTCGVPPVVATVNCSHNPFPIINTDIVWTADVTPAGSYNYNWTIGHTPTSDYQLVSGAGSLTTNTITLQYKTPGNWTASDLDVTVTDGGGALVGTGHCPASITGYTVGDKGFRITADTSMTTQFIRSVRSVTFPDVTLTIEPFGGFNDSSVSINFSRILAPDGSTVKGLEGAGSGVTLIVEPQFWKIATPDAIANTIILNRNPDGSYEKAVLRLKLTKNQNSVDQLLSSSPNYSVIVDRIGGGSQLSIPLKVNNPSGGVIER